jgi:hypothetical protein
MNNPTIMNSEQYNSYFSGLNASVEQYKLMNPEKYETAQAIGNDMMSLSYDLESGIDMKGSCLRCKNLLVSIYQYGLEKEDLYDEEYELLKYILVFHLNCLEKVDDIFQNQIQDFQDILNRCMQLLDKKIKELSNDN